jgi:hypothetical protein
MYPSSSTVRRLLAAAAFVLPVAARADPVTFFVPYEGAGNLSVFDLAAGTGGWVGSIEQSPFPPVPSPWSLVSVVLFTLDASTLTLSGSFEFTNSADLGSALFGAVTGSYVDPDILANGGQFSIDYTIQGGTGAYSGAAGYGLSFVDFDPAGGFDNYTEGGALVVAVPEPGALALTLTGLMLLASVATASRRRDARLGA